MRVGQTGALVARPDGQGPGTVSRKIWGEVGCEVTNHLVHWVSVEHEEGGVVPDAVETPLYVLLTHIIIGELSDKPLNG